MVSKLAVQSRSASLIASLSALLAAGHRHHLGAHQPHPEDVQFLPRDVVRAHVDAGFQPEQGADHRGGDAVLAGAGLGDQPRLAHPPGEQGLAEHLVGLVGAAVEQILALQIDARLAAAEVAAQGQRRRPPGIIGEQSGKLGLEAGIVLRGEEGGLELLERRHQDLRHIGAAIGAETARHQHGAASPRTGSRSAAKKAPSRAGILAPGRRLDARADVEPISADPRRLGGIFRPQAAGEQGRTELAAPADPRPVEGDAGAAALAADRGVEQGPVGAEPRLRHRVADRARRPDLDALGKQALRPLI